jgi:hypothetical protein
MRPLSSLLIFIGSALAAPGAPWGQAPSPPGPDPPRASGQPLAKQALLEKAGAYVAGLEEPLSLMRARERYVQTLWAGSPPSAQTTRILESDVLWVPVGNPIVWAFYRDVRSVDGRRVRDREERLAKLFAGGVSDVARGEARRILAESSRFNLGSLLRTTTSPSLAIAFLHPRNQPRCRFQLVGSSLFDGRLAQEVEFEETRRGTLIRTARGRDQPARGRFWIAAADGAVVRSEMWVAKTPARFEVRYGRDPASGLFLPLEFREDYGRGTDEEVRTVATYSDFERAQTGVGKIQIVH